MGTSKWVWLAGGGVLLAVSTCAWGQTAPRGTKSGDNLSLQGVRMESAPLRPNLIPNPGFEQLDAGGFPAGWQWDHRNTDSTCAVDDRVVHSGKHSLHFTNRTPFGANVYGMIWMAAPIPVTAGQPYTLSAWVKSDDPGTAWIGGGVGWQFRLQFKPTGGQWQRVSMPFQPDNNSFMLRMVTEAPTKGFWVDDIKLESGAAATPVALDPTSTNVTLDSELLGREIGGDGPFELPFLVSSAHALPGVHVEVSLQGAAATLSRPVSLPAGVSRLVVEGQAAGVSSVPRTLQVRILEGQQERGSTTLTLTFTSYLFQQQRLQRLRAALPGLNKVLDSLRHAGQDVSYPDVTCSLLGSFVNYVQEDLQREEGASHPFVNRARMQLDEMEGMLDRVQAEMAAARAGKRLPTAPRWTGAERPRVVGSRFIGPVKVPPRVKPEDRPIFFTGYGHFGQVVTDIPNFPHYGTNIIQIERGPSSVFPKEGPPSPVPAQELKAILDRAQKAGVAVNLLISPHYMPDWMLQKYPELRKRREGFLQYCLHAPEGQDFLKQFVPALLGPIKDHPALHSICLSNEPVNMEEPCKYAAEDWHRWLQRRHGTIAALNEHWGSHYERFNDVPLPNPYAPPAGPPWMDFIRFNEDFFAGWHKMLADAVHKVAPDLPVHAKTMTWTLVNDGDVRYGVDATRFDQMTDINGNDSANYYNFGSGEFAQGWQGNALSYDLQRSVKDAPVFNSENHVIPDGDQRPVPPEHVRALLWQSAIHGESATTIWVWERTFDSSGGFVGDIMFRPACAEAVGRVNLDLNRAAREVTAIQEAPADVMILQGPTPAVWDGGRYMDCMNKLYTALAFTGLKAGFITEPQLEMGIAPAAPVVFIPNIGHLSSAAVKTLAGYRGRIIFVGGSGVLSDEYDHPLPAPLAGESLPYTYPNSTWHDLWNVLLPRLTGWGLHPRVDIVDAAKQPVWGVEWRSAALDGSVVVNLCNQRNIDQTVQLQVAGHPAEGVDVLTGQPVRGPLTLNPLEVRLLKVQMP